MARKNGMAGIGRGAGLAVVAVVATLVLGGSVSPWAAVASPGGAPGRGLATARRAVSPARAHAHTRATRSGAHSRRGPRATGASPKPDGRGADLGNSGAEAVSGPLITPTQVFTASPQTGMGVAGGIELDGVGNVIFTQGDGTVYSYNPTTQARTWGASGTAANGTDPTGAASAPVVSADGHVYLAGGGGHLYAIDTATGAASPILTDAAPVAQTLKVDDATHTLFFGGQDHAINGYAIAPGAAGTAPTLTPLYRLAASGATQDATLPGCAGATTGEAQFYGEGALGSDDTFYIASREGALSQPRACASTDFGTLYKVSPRGALLAAAPLAGAVVGAVALTTNPITPGEGEAVVATSAGYVEAFDTASLTRLWATPLPGAAFTVSPLLDAARNRMYVADDSHGLYALNLSSGAVDPAFNGGALKPLTGGAAGSPVLDAGGNVYVVDRAGMLSSVDPTGATRYSVATGMGSSVVGLAIAGDGTLYVGGAVGQVGQVSGFNRPVALAAGSPTATTGLTATATATATATVVAGGAATGSPTATMGLTATAPAAATAPPASTPSGVSGTPAPAPSATPASDTADPLGLGVPSSAPVASPVSYTPPTDGIPDMGYSFATPATPPVLSRQQAIAMAQVKRSSTGTPSKVQALYVVVTSSNGGFDHQPVWIVTFEGVLVPAGRPGRPNSEDNFVIDARTGQGIIDFSYR